MRGLSDDREAMKQGIRALRGRIEQLAGERQQAEKDVHEHTRRWRERMEELKQQGHHVGFHMMLLMEFLRWYYR